MTESPRFTPTVFHPPRAVLPAPWVTAVRATCESRDDIVCAHWVTTEFPGAEIAFQDELHFELADPPGDYGPPREFWREFEWVDAPLGSSPVWAFTPGRLLSDLRSVSAVIWEKR